MNNFQILNNVSEINIFHYFSFVSLLMSSLHGSKRSWRSSRSVALPPRMTQQIKTASSGCARPLELSQLDTAPNSASSFCRTDIAASVQCYRATYCHLFGTRLYLFVRGRSGFLTLKGEQISEIGMQEQTDTADNFVPKSDVRAPILLASSASFDTWI